MLIVDRLFTQLAPKPEDPDNTTPHPLLHYRSHSAIVVLGDPGMGKSTAFTQSAAIEPNAVFVSIRDFLTLQAERWEGKVLYLDGLDEQRAKTEDGRGALDRIRGKLDELKRPAFRLSCRAADWYGGSEMERLCAVSSDGKVLVLRLEPLSDADIITIAGIKLADPVDFLAQAQRHGIDSLLRNPQTLQLIIAEVQNGVWPATRADLYQKACQRLLQETNAEHVQGTTHIEMNRLMAAAGYLCVVHLCGGTKGYALSPQDADEAYPYVCELAGDQEAIVSVVRRRVFRADGSGCVTPIHRTIGEYLSANFIAQRIRAGYPLKRALALLTGYDGGTLAELRGIYAWLACLCEEEAAMLIRRDPLGLVLYGDVSVLSTSGKAMLIGCLRDLAITNPSFRAENWSAEPFGALASPDMVPLFKKILSDKTELPHLLGCILDAIEYGSPLPDMADDLLQIVRDDSRLEGARIGAYEAFCHVCPNDHAILRTLLEDVQEGRIRDEDNRLRGKLLQALYPVTIGPHEIGRYLVQLAEHTVNAYSIFLAHELVDRTDPEALPFLLSAVDSSRVVGSPHHFVWEDFYGRLILKLLQQKGESASSAHLYEWLGSALDEHDAPIVDREEAKAIQTWLRSHLVVVQGLFCHWFSITPFKKPHVEVHYFWRRLQGMVPPGGFHYWLLNLAEHESDPGRAEFLFREAVHGRTALSCADAPTIDELFEFADRNARFRATLHTDMCCNIDSWQQEDAERRRTRHQTYESQRAKRVQQLSELLEELRSGRAIDALIFLAHAYFGRFQDIDRENSPSARLEGFTNAEIASAALDGFLAALQRSDIETPEMIAEWETEGKHYNIGFVILAGMDVLAGRSFADLLSLPKSTLQSGLAFHYAILTERNREWVHLLIDAMPSLTAEALYAYWGPHLAHNSKHIMGLYDLVYEEVMRPIAQSVSICLLKDYPNTQVDNLELLLHAALRNADRKELLSLTEHTVEHCKLADENRAAWYAAAFAIGHEEATNSLAALIDGKKDHASRILNFLCPSRGVKTDPPYRLSIPGFVTIITMLGPLFPPQTLRTGITRNAEETSSAVRSLIRRLGKEPSHEAAIALAKLQDVPGLLAWRAEIAHVLADHARQRREHAFKYPSVDQVIKTINQGRPTNATDLQALVLSHLETIRAELRDGPTDGWKGMWNVDQYGKPREPRPENDCRDRILDFLRPRLLPVEVAPEKEGHYAEDKRADIKNICGPLNLPVEIKRHYHCDVWTAPGDQLNKLYARDPGTAGRGIYLALWFGIEAGPLPTHPKGHVDICTPAQFEQALLDTLQPSEEELLGVMVFDCSVPGTREKTKGRPRHRATAKKSKIATPRPKKQR